jgi:hypothetical protein
MSKPNVWRVRAANTAARMKDSAIKAGEQVVLGGRAAWAKTASTAADAYTSAVTWTDNSEFSHWLTRHFSDQHATIASKAMDAEYLRNHVGGSWHRLYDGGHTIAGSWKAVSDALPDVSALDRIGTWANEYWKDLITARGMPIVLLDHGSAVSEYFRHLDSVNVAELIGGKLVAVSIYTNWNDPKKLVETASASEFGGLYYANVVSPLISLIGLGRAYVLLRDSEQEDLRELIEPAVKGLTRSGATIMLITVIPGGFLVHLSSGIVISILHGIAWDAVKDNRDVILRRIRHALVELRGAGDEIALVDSTDPLTIGVP